MLCNNASDLSKKMSDDYALYQEMRKKGTNKIVDSFMSGGLYDMYNMINILLSGDDQQVSTAVLLFNMLKNGKASAHITSGIIYNNLPFASQIKLKRNVKMMKNEITRIKNLSYDSIPMEQKLASITNMPDGAKRYILDKADEIYTPEMSSKIQMAID